jgi:hypothetical protein
MTKNTKSEKIKNLCIFLKLVWETTKNEYSIFGLSSQARDLNIAYYNNLPKVLKDKGILDAKEMQGTGTGRHVGYKWVSNTEPNIHMAKAIMDAMSDIHCSYKNKNSNADIANEIAVIEPEETDTELNQLVRHNNELEKYIGKKVFGITVGHTKPFVYGHIYEILISTNGTIYRITNGREGYMCDDFVHTQEELKNRLLSIAITEIQIQMKDCYKEISEYERRSDDI